jgi:hypothetical protein
VELILEEMIKSSGGVFNTISAYYYCFSDRKVHFRQLGLKVKDKKNPNQVTSSAK